jgi:hypothetical protein
MVTRNIAYLSWIIPLLHLQSLPHLSARIWYLVVPSPRLLCSEWNFLLPKFSLDSMGVPGVCQFFYVYSLSFLNTFLHDKSLDGFLLWYIPDLMNVHIRDYPKKDTQNISSTSRISPMSSINISSNL